MLGILNRRQPDLLTNDTLEQWREAAETRDARKRTVQLFLHAERLFPCEIHSGADGWTQVVFNPSNPQYASAEAHLLRLRDAGLLHLTDSAVLNSMGAWAVQVRLAVSESVAEHALRRN